MPALMIRRLAIPLCLACCTAAPALADAVMTGTLPRGADLGFVGAGRDGALTVIRLDPDGAAARAGIADRDLIVAVNGRRFDKDYVGEDLLRRLDGGRPARLTLRRAGEERIIRFTPPPLPLEDLPGVTSTYGEVPTPDGARLRSIVTVPDGTSGRLPAIFVTQWVSCDGVDLARSSVTGDVLAAVATRAEAVMLRVERASGGDSEGPGCHELDYDTEVAHYRHAFEQLVRQHPRVDPARVVVWGHSLGSTVAPLVARGHEVAGVAVSGAGAVTYLERMINFDRIGFERGGTPPAEIHDRMIRHIRFHLLYLIAGMTPEAIASAHPELADVWRDMRGTGDGVHYGRPYAWHQQAAGHNFLAAWSEIDAPVLALFNEYDQFELAHGHALIAGNANRLRPGSGRYVIQPGIGHSHRAYPTAEDAAAFRRGQPVPLLTAERILEWLAGEVGVRLRAPAE